MATRKRDEAEGPVLDDARLERELSAETARRQVAAELGAEPGAAVVGAVLACRHERAMCAALGESDAELVRRIRAISTHARLGGLDGISWRRFLQTAPEAAKAWTPERIIAAMCLDAGKEIERAQRVAEKEQQARQAKREEQRELEELGRRIAQALDVAKNVHAADHERDRAIETVQRLAPGKFAAELAAVAEQRAFARRAYETTEQRGAELAAKERAARLAEREQEHQRAVDLGRRATGQPTEEPAS